MADCPELSAIDDARDPVVADHVAQCASCRVVVELLAERRREVDARDRRDECALFEMLIAARDAGTIVGSAGTLLDEHLRECADCQVVAATMPPPSDRPNASSLPAVSTASYALGREVARGGMGRILDAEDTRIGRRVAVKELLGRSPALAARFEREARVTARLQHPGIVPIYEIGKWPDGTPFYAMRMVEGRTLRDAIRGCETLEARLALLPAVIAAAEAVAFAHARHVIHRDLTPSNILVGEYGDTVVIDWGLAKDLGALETEDGADPYRDPSPPALGLTNVGAVLGTAAYMPPEQARGATVDERADVYALGAILYHLLAGEPPYRGSTSEDVVRAVQEGPPVSIGNAARGTPRDLISIVEKAMMREPADRYATAGDLVEELRRYRTGRLVEAHAYSAGERLRRWIRTHRALVVASAASIVVLVVAGSIGLAGILRERNRAELARAKAESENALLMEEQGRQELLAGNTTRALAWLNEAYKAGDTSAELRFMLGTAMQTVESIVHTEDCGGKVQSVEFSADGSRVLAVCQFGIGIARTSDWKREVEIDTQADGGVLSHDARLVASWDYNRLSIWNATTGARTLGPLTLGGQIHTAHFTPDDAVLVTSSHDGRLQSWDVHTGTALRSMAAGSGAMNIVNFNLTPDGHWAVSMTADGKYRVWDLAAGTVIREFSIPSQPIGSEQTMISPDGARVVTCSADGRVSITEIASGAIVTSFPAHANVAFECGYSRDGRVLLTTGMDGTAKVWDAATGRLVSTLHHGSVWVQGTLSPDGERVATVGSGGSVKIWHAPSGALLASYDDPFGGNDHLVYSPDGRTLITSRNPSTLVVIRDPSLLRRTIALPAGAQAEGGSPDLSRIIAALPDGALSLVDVTTGRSLPHEPIRRPFAFSRSSARLAAVSTDGVVVIDAKTGATLARFAGPAPEMLALDDRGRRLLLVGSRAVVWNVDRHDIALELAMHSDKDCLSPGGDVLVAWNDPREVETWNIDGKSRQARILLPRETLGPVGFDASGRAVVVSEKEGPVAGTGTFPLVKLGLYDVQTGEKRADLGRSVFASVDRDRQYLTSSVFDGRLVIYDMATGARLHEVSMDTAQSAGQTAANGALVAATDIETLAIRSPTDGRRLASLRTVVRFQIGENQFLANSPDILVEGGRLLVLGTHPMLWALPDERRPTEEIDRIVRARVRWKVIDGHLVAATATLRGRVVRHGEPIAHAEVGVERGTGWLFAITDARGTFEIPALPSGHYGVVVMAPEHDAKGMHDVSLEADDVVRDFDLDEEATITGEVVDASGQPVAGVQIQAGLQEGALRATSDAKGAFTIRALGVAAYRLHVVKMRDGVPTGFVAESEEGTPVAVHGKSEHVSGVRMVVRRVPVMP